MNNNKLLYIIPVLLLLTFSCQNDDNASNNNSCDGHLSYRINGEFREANCNFIEDGYGNDDIVITAIHHTIFSSSGSQNYVIGAKESIGTSSIFSIAFYTENLITQPITITTEFPNNTFSGDYISDIQFNDTDPSTSYIDGLVWNGESMTGSTMTLDITTVDGRYISGTFNAVIINKHLVTGVFTTYTITDGIFENIYIEPA